jgi:transposase
LNAADDPAEKVAALRRHHALNPRPQAVSDPAFTATNPFFDANDLVQVKYEMLRRVRGEGQRVSQASAAFGFSRPSFYEALTAFEEAGLPGLVPQRPGPRRAHKLSGTVLDALDAALAEDPTLNSAGLAGVVFERFGLRVHPRSVERALQRRRKGGPQTRA